MAKKQISQDTFDEAVKTNIEDFDMEADEAVKSAIEEFKMQDFDLSGIITTAEGGNVSSHPLMVATQALERATSSEGASTTQAEDARTALADITNLLSAAGKDDILPLLAVAGKANTLQAVLRYCQQYTSDQAGLLQALGDLRRLVLSLQLKATFLEAGGVEQMNALMAASDDVAVQGAVAAVAEAATHKDEQNKCRFFGLGFGDALLQLLQRPDLPDGPLMSACGALRSLANADDERLMGGSKAFTHARLLAKQAGALKVLLGVLQRARGGRGPAPGPEACAAVLVAVRQIAANDEICKEFKDDGGVLACLELLRGSLSDPDIVRAACGALRQLANNDSIKELLAEHGALQLIVSLLHSYGHKEDVQEGALGLLVNMTLRMPAISAAAAEAGCVGAILEAMSVSPGAPLVQRQASMAIRNMVVRNTELRPQFLEAGAEALLRAARRTHPSNCKDVAAAALRDLGLDNYNE